MNKEKLAQLLAEALDKNCSINIHFSQFHNDENRTPVTSVEAKELVAKYAEAIGASSIKHNVGNPYADDYMVDTGDFRVCCCYIPSAEEALEGKQQKIERLKKELVELENSEEALA